MPPVQRSGETTGEQFLRGEQIQLDYDDWNKVPKIYNDKGCIADRSKVPSDTAEPFFCSRIGKGDKLTLPDKTQVETYSLDSRSKTQTLDFFQDYRHRTLVKSPHAVVSLVVSVISVLGLLAFWSAKKR